ncbi:glycosyltransferase family 39 protein [Allokutzneria sp. A3M-2-11 16]|uniref:ArnT family glycosyltransferase n=1 Tax=Allokutzneria sp. A3M-2-11 16 TaxID=2962043 RepID=UPI0020B88257|nr:glycosyltransferase family 39 protein [Allokutzneria sp. A3M-2-11 16]MCP3805504.1 glycosyltransferase family 39 protein [Allokutzneria sp. A3M-2-11 16]
MATSTRSWERPALIALLGSTALLYLWALGDSGWANAYYSAAAQAGGESWTAWLFGSTDAANGITVDKPPASLWLMALSVRLFGLSSWSVLVPQALLGVASVWLLYATVRRQFPASAALLGAAVLALTPVAVLMFRFNNPDALLVLLLIAAAYFLTRAVEDGRTRWMLLCGSMIGFAFLTKMLQAFLVLPTFALAFLIAQPTLKRVAQLFAAALAMIVAGGWWVLVVELVPASARPYIGGSQTNSILELTLGYNGFGRLTGDEVGKVGGGGFNSAGLGRLFGGEMAGQIAWLLPAALVLLAFGLYAGKRERSAFVMWGGWLVVTGLVFSYMNGIIHSYYTVALAPAIAALIGMGSAVAWRERERGGSVALFLAVGGTAMWSAFLLSSTMFTLAITIAVVGLGAAVLLLFAGHLPQNFVRGAVVAGLIGALAAPTAYSVVTAATPHSGALPSAGPGRSTSGGMVMFGPTGNNRAMGSLLDAGTPGAEITALLRARAENYTWTAAAVGSNSAAGFQLASRTPVLAVGGFNGTDPAPTLAQFQEYVRSGQIHYFLGGAGMRAESGSDESRRIAEWVAATFTPSTVDGVTVYDLTS